MTPKKPTTETATFAAGCFWCIEAIFKELNGVLEVAPGYSGGTIPNPTYEQVCTGKTGHAEAVQVHFDSGVISYSDLLDVFLSIHDPTTPNCQGTDVGTQYRSVIFYHDEQQRAVAEASRKKAESSGLWQDPIVTEIIPFRAFYQAEENHKDYFRRNRNQPYCRLVVDPKLRKFRKEFKRKGLP